MLHLIDLDESKTNNSFAYGIPLAHAQQVVQGLEMKQLERVLEKYSIPGKRIRYFSG